jgi:hypothetical protein
MVEKTPCVRTINTVYNGNRLRARDHGLAVRTGTNPLDLGDVSKYACQPGTQRIGLP